MTQRVESIESITNRLLTAHRNALMSTLAQGAQGFSPQERERMVSELATVLLHLHNSEPNNVPVSPAPATDAPVEKPSASLDCRISTNNITRRVSRRAFEAANIDLIANFADVYMPTCDEHTVTLSGRKATMDRIINIIGG